MKYCKFCAAQLKDEAQFCPECGKAQNDIPVTPTPRAGTTVYTPAPAPVPAPANTMNNAIIALVAIVAVFVGGACFWMYQQTNKPVVATKPAATAQQAAPSRPAAPAPAQTAPAATPAPAVAAPAPAVVPSNTGLITGVDVRMRAGAGTSYAILGYYDKGERVAILSTVEGWYKVRRYNGDIGWVSADFCAR